MTAPQPGQDHLHSHDHVHAHGSHGSAGGPGHEHPLEGYHVHGGAPALDIGGDIGAMVVTMDAASLGTELHLRSEHEPPTTVHTGVWERGQGGATVVAAVFPDLVEGTYHLLDHAGEAVRRVQVVGGQVTSVDLRG